MVHWGEGNDMHIVRFIFPFLFVRNWYDGSWELSRPRLAVFFAIAAFILLGICIVSVLQSPITYTAPS